MAENAKEFNSLPGPSVEEETQPGSTFSRPMICLKLLVNPIDKQIDFGGD